MTQRPLIDNATARRIWLHRHGLARTEAGTGRGADLADVIGGLGFVQLDSVNTLARAHDLILWSRRQQYRPSALNALLHRDRGVFEHWTHDASVIPIEYFPHWRHRFARDRERLKDRWTEWHKHDFLAQLDAVRDRITVEGECKSGDLGGDEPRKSGGWWDWHPAKTALEYLWRVGEVSVIRRDGFQKVYDLTERVIPDHLRRQETESGDTIDWACNAAMDRLGFATSGEVSAFFDLVSPAEAREWCASALARGEIEEVDIQGADGALRKSIARPGLLQQPLEEPSGRVRILSPFDPALRDRKRAERLFGFHYRIEIFVPAPKRIYGYYVFPVMEGDRLIGRIDAKTDRPAAALDVTAFWPEAGVAMGKGRVAKLMAELDRVARFADCPTLRVADGWLRDPA